jgi:hypothetical protein
VVVGNGYIVGLVPTNFADRLGQVVPLTGCTVEQESRSAGFSRLSSLRELIDVALRRKGGLSTGLSRRCASAEIVFEIFAACSAASTVIGSADRASAFWSDCSTTSYTLTDTACRHFSSSRRMGLFAAVVIGVHVLDCNHSHVIRCSAIERLFDELITNVVRLLFYPYHVADLFIPQNCRKSI